MVLGRRNQPGACFSVDESRYNNEAYSQANADVRREDRREMIAWLLCKHEAAYRCIVSGGPK